MFPENTIFVVFSAKHSSCNKKMYVEKTETLREKSWVVFGTWRKGVFWIVFFSGFNVFVVCFCVFGKVANVLKMPVSPVFWGFWGVVCSCLFGFGRFWCFCVLVFVFLLFRFSFLYFALFLFCCWIVFGVVLVFVFGV